MTSANVIECEEPEVAEAIPCCEVRMPAGLLGFEHMKDYLLIAKPGEAPFRWLQVKNNPALAFVVIEPLYFMPDYQPDIPQADVELLELTSPDDAAVYVIVTVSGSAPRHGEFEGANRHQSQHRRWASRWSSPTPRNTRSSSHCRSTETPADTRHAHPLAQIRRKHRD